MSKEKKPAPTSSQATSAASERFPKGEWDALPESVRNMADYVVVSPASGKSSKKN